MTSRSVFKDAKVYNLQKGFNFNPRN